MSIGSNSIASRSAPLSASSRTARLGLIALILGAVVAAFAFAGGLLRPEALTPSKMIDAFERANGEHAGFRRNHAKGVGISGYFESNGKGAALSKAFVFRVGRYPVIGRFAIAGGKPAGTDTPSSVRSMALLIKLPNGEEWRTGMNDIPVFGVSTPQAFYEQLLASAPDPKTGKPDPAKVSAFLSKFPSAAKASQLIRSEPKAPSFETDTFNSLNSFRFTNDAGAVQAVRWSMVPSKVPSNTPSAAPAGPNYSFDALIGAVHLQPVEWHLDIVLAQPGDPLDDATVPWPADRPRVDVGTLRIDHVESEDTSSARDINFDPLVLPDGIGPSDDPLLSARSAAYSESFTRREGEHKTPSAVSTTSGVQ